MTWLENFLAGLRAFGTPKQVFDNNCTGRLVVDLDTATTAFDFTIIGGNWPYPLDTDEFFHVTLSDGTGRYEIVKVTATTRTRLTVLRGQDGSLAQAWSADTALLSMRVIAGTMLNGARKDEGNTFTAPQHLSAGAVVNEDLRAKDKLTVGPDSDPAITVQAAEDPDAPGEQTYSEITAGAGLSLLSPNLRLNNLRMPPNPLIVEGQALYVRDGDIVGVPNAWYLGALTSPPVQLPGGDPLMPGVAYFNLLNSTVYFWNGLSWTSGFAPAPAGGAHLVYVLSGATATINVTSDADDLGNTHAPHVDEDVRVHVNGLLLLKTVTGFVTGAYEYDNATGVLTFSPALGVSDEVQIEFIIPNYRLAPGAVNMTPLLAFDTDWGAGFPYPTGLVDGVQDTFDLYYDDLLTAITLAPIADAAHLAVFYDGVRQKPGTDYAVVGTTIVFSSAPQPDADLWALWHRPGATS